MRYITQIWSSENDSILYFIQRLEEMLFHYSDDIVKAPVHNTATLIIEYIILSKDNNIQNFHLDIVADELRESLQNDLIIKERIGVKKVQKLLDSLKCQQKDTVNYLSGLISFPTYYGWCIEYLLNNISIANAKTNIRQGLRSWISSVIWAGYTPEYVYRYLRLSFDKKVDEPLQAITSFVQHFNMEQKEFRVYFLFMSMAEPYRELLMKRLNVVFKDDGHFDSIYKKDNKSFVGYIDVKAIDPYCATQKAHQNLDIFVSFYRVISNRKKDLIAKNATVRDIVTNEEIKLPVAPRGYNVIEVEPQLNLVQQIDTAVIGCQSKHQKTYISLNKIITLHNMALRQVDLADGFVNLWSVLEVVSKGVEKKSKIDAVVYSILPILHNDYFIKYFMTILEDLKTALPKIVFANLMNKVTQGESEIFKLMCLIFLPEYKKILDECFTELSQYPNIRQKIYKMWLLRKRRNEVFNLSERYAKRLKWHLYRLYRVRNGIVHAGETDKNIQVLGEHLHIYCDGVILEIITKLSSDVSLMTLNDVLLDTRLLNETKKEFFDLPGDIIVEDIKFMLMGSFKEIETETNSADNT